MLQADTGESRAPFFSVIVPTRNRPETCREAIESVLAQDFADLEVIVVNDGSAPESRRRYDRLAAELGGRVKWFHQPLRDNGHGPSYSINSGAKLAAGRYLCLLDDDDCWTDPEHLKRVHQVITGLADEVDAYYSNQRAFRASGEEVALYLWLSPLVRRLPDGARDRDPAYLVTPEFLLRCNSFPHPNCTILRREFFRAVGGMDEGIRYECEVDLYLRCLDRANSIVYDPHFVARHNVPDHARRASVSTAVSTIGKLLSQMQVYQKNLVGARRGAVRTVCRERLALACRKLALEVQAAGQRDTAARLSSVASAFGASWKWRIYSLYLRTLARFTRAFRKRGGERQQPRPVEPVPGHGSRLPVR